MSQLLTLKQIRGMEAGEVIPCVSGTLTAVYESKSGQGKKKPWTVQNCEITQGNDSMRVSIWNREEDIPTKWKGKKITIIATEGQNGDLSGVQAEDNDYKNKVTRQIKVSCDYGGEITLGGSGSAGANAGGEGQEQEAEPAKPAPGQRPNPFQAGVFGGTVGHAQKLVHEVLCAYGIPMFLSKDGVPIDVNPQYCKLLWIGSSAIIRVSRMLEDGKLAPNTTKSAAPAPAPKPKPQPKPEPEPTPQEQAEVAGDQPLEEDQVPF
ncbi:MAG: hypothetical protein KGL39_02900 [Patescibacteria group bacterium]|nr:hypothetical protein [Patescibacteria group bacterium]